MPHNLLEIPLVEPLPQVIFLDAVGTLFGVRGSVGEVYAKIADRYGVECDPAELNRCFYRVFKQAPPCIFPDAKIDRVPALEFGWWREINVLTFTAAGVWSKFSDFDRFFSDLYHYFQTAEPWEIYPETIAALERWQQRGITLGVLSNFDSRLYPVLDALDLRRYFSSITISTAVSAAKPQLKIFTAALACHDCPPARAWHIGDSWEEDYLGATAAGLSAIWIDRI
jgi:putative hydrolase of the HAD superfamily